MHKIIKTYKWDILLFLSLSVLYFVLRLPNLTIQPIFADEAIYIRWAQVMKAEPTLRFLPLSDGKTPLFMWAMIPFFKLFHDPLFAGRFLSILSGYLTLLGVFLIGYKFFNRKVGFWSVLLIVVTPFIFFFDRMALVDSLLAAFSIWSLFFGLLLINYSRLDLAMFLGYVLGGGLLTKTPGFFNLLSLPATLLIFNWKGRDRQSRLLKLCGLWMVAIVITLIIYNLLRLGPGFVGMSSRNQDYIFSPIDLLGRPLDPFIPHIRDLIDWFPKLFTPPILLFVLLGSILAVIKRDKTAISILLWSLLPLCAELALLKTFTARYILFSIPPLLILAGWAISNLSETLKLKNFFIPALLIFLLPLSLYFDFLLISDPTKAPLPREERRGYLEDWTAGYGFPEIAKFLINEAQNGTVIVGTEGNFGTLPDGLMIYLDRYVHQAPPDKKVVLVGDKAGVSEKLREAALKNKTYYVANKSRYLRPESGLQLIKAFPKAVGPDFPQDEISFFRIFPLE